MANPYAVFAVVSWTIILCAVAAWMVRSDTRGKAIGRFLLFAGLVLSTLPAQLLIGNLLYRITDSAITSVSFLGGPPVWIGPVVSCVVALGTWFYIRAGAPRS
jgi:hypothetical protein